MNHLCKRMLPWTLGLFLWVPSFGQQGSPHVCPTQPPVQFEIDKAVERAVTFLQAEMHKVHLRYGSKDTLEELLLAALVYGGLPEIHKDIQWLLSRVLDRLPQRTYETVLLAIALDKLDNEVYLWKLVECAQFLLDNQCGNGQWPYGEPFGGTKPLQAKTKSLIRDLRTWGHRRRRVKSTSKSSTQAQPRIELKAAWTFRQPSGDNSNTQFLQVNGAKHHGGSI